MCLVQRGDVRLPGALTGIACVLLEPSRIDQPEKIPPEPALAGGAEDERNDLHRGIVTGSLSQRCPEEGRQPRADPGRVDNHPGRLPDGPCQIDELIGQRSVRHPGPDAPVDNPVHWPAIGSALDINLDHGERGAVAPPPARTAIPVTRQIAPGLLLARDIDQQGVATARPGTL